MEGMLQKQGLRPVIRSSTPAVSLGMNFGLLISLASPKLPFKLSQTLCTSLSAGFFHFYEY